jgi:hypothetical protein
MPDSVSQMRDLKDTPGKYGGPFGGLLKLRFAILPILTADENGLGG